MSCYPNGAPVPADPTPRNLWQDRITAAIAIDFTIGPFTEEVVMEQWTMHLSAVPAAAEYATLTKISGVSAVYSTLLLRFDFATESVQDLACVTPFRFIAGDSVNISYPNTNLVTVGTEWLGIQLIP